MSQRILDVRREDLLAATTALQRLALALFEELFESGPGLTAGRWFGRSDVRVLDRLPASRLGWRRLIARAAPFLSDAVTDRRRWSGSPRQLRWSGGAVRARLALEAHGADGLLIPDRLLGLVARAAWESPDFRVQVSRLALDHFRSRLVVPAGGVTAPRIAPELVWMLVAAARVSPPKLARLGLAHRVEVRALARLQRFAIGVLEDTSLPGDFWSHWIAWHIERRYHRRSTLPPEWHSRLSVADRRGDTTIRQRHDAGDATTAWLTPEALASAYAAWYPQRERQQARAGAERGLGSPRATA
jgi:hypothetical protein